MAKPNTLQTIILRLVIEESGCITWPGTRDKSGYGRVKLDGHTRLVHRVVYEHFRGVIPEGLQPDHLCRNTSCANPWHVELVTPRENVLRNNGPSAKNAVKTACKRGHELAGDNLYVNPRGERQCCECQRARGREFDTTHRDQRRLYGRTRYSEHSERLRAYRRARYYRQKEDSNADRS